jgi:alkanesulfonate monooxygenase SsuD/methylene tetrahydromethanopterin reductase-like flavin-dependent oxidoreductase (luciferase family)
MRFGLFASPQADGAGGAPGRAGVAPGEGFRDFIEFCVEAEALGYHGVFSVEHHFSGWNQVSATLTLLTFLAARTRTLRLGTAVMVLPWHNPVLLAEQAATLDLLSDGRLDLGIGKGYRHNEFKGFGIPIDEADARFEEALDVIVKAWTATERFSHHGRFWNFDDVVVEPPTRQKPHPPLWMAAASEASLRRVAMRGHNLILDQFASIELTGQRLAFFRREVEAHGRAFDPMTVTVARDMHVATNAADKDAAIARSKGFHQRILNVARAPTREGGSHILAYSHSAEESAAASLIGTPDEIAAKIEALRRAGVGYVILSCGGSRENLRRFARDIMPAFAAERADVAEPSPV